MPPRRGRSAKTKVLEKSPSKPTAAGWDSEDDLLADDPTQSALSAFPSISSGLVDEDALLGTKLEVSSLAPAGMISATKLYE